MKTKLLKLKKYFFSDNKISINFILCIIMPFVAVFLRTKKYRFVALNFFLILFLWIPAVINAFGFTSRNKENVYPPIYHNIVVIFVIFAYVILIDLLFVDSTFIMFTKIVLGYFRTLLIILCTGSFLLFALTVMLDDSKSDGRTATGYSSNILPSTEWRFLLYSCIFGVAQWFLGKFSILPDWVPTFVG